MTPRENELSQQLFGGKEPPVITPLEAVTEALKEFKENMAPGLTWDKVISDIGQELKQQAAHGAHEIAAALFGNGHSGFVMYPRTNGNDGQGKDGAEQAQDGQSMQQDANSQHLERGGRSM